MRVLFGPDPRWSLEPDERCVAAGRERLFRKVGRAHQT